ncbi:GNAT family N-acetyltransferase [Siculibacillus lacustris]|uniref:GNAT family N-acetyltransferase n=1 Tax=Siculibacillus lacustris TaxID=1549641 RepID=A0A4Q9VSN5_9HYPH|nr:GNAT family N-acetyltransferase [Siculibacillus lacustris]TBW38676.1 GNAT family N-acetyltransferase [Siculibacillus lacustris]
MTVTIRSARPGEAGLILNFVQKLSAYEKLDHELVATEAMLDDALFCDNPRVFCEFAELDGVPVGFAMWFYNFSTFRGRHGIYLEDLFVEPEHQGHGIGKALLRHLAKRCVDEGLGRFEWWVLDWNEPSIAFYKSLGSISMDEWTVFRVTDAALVELAEGRRGNEAVSLGLSDFEDGEGRGE